MFGGYAGRFLWVDLATGKLKVKVPDEKLLRDYVGGYGVAAREEPAMVLRDLKLI